MASTIAEAMLQIQRDEARRDLTFAHTAMRNALAELADGDTDGAMETLRQIVGDPNDECQHEVFESGRCLHCGATEQEISEAP